MPGSHAHLCEGKEWLEVLPESNRLRKWKLSQREEVGVRCVLCQKNEGREAGQKNIPGAWPHAYYLILSHLELMENTKNYIHRYTWPRMLLLPKVLTSHWMQQVYHFHSFLFLLSPPHPPTLEQTVRWLNINTRFGHLFFLLKVESGKMRYSNSWLNVLCLVAQSCPTLWDPMDSSPGSSVRGDSPGKSTGVGCHAFLQGIVPTQESNPGLLHCRQILLPSEPPGKPFTE